MIATLCLGTAAIGLEHYGIANQTGKPDDPEMTAMLDAFIGAEGAWIDTAAAYGDAEERLGRYHVPMTVKCVSKLLPNLFDGPCDVEAIVRAEFEATSRRLGRTPHVYLLHSSRYVFRDDVIRAMNRLRHDVSSLIVGASCYEPDEVFAAIRAGFGAVQVPYSLFDQRCEAVMATARAHGVMVFARAPFVQGLVFVDPGELPKHLEHARPHIERLRTLCDDVARTALHFSLQCPWVDIVVFGAECTEQVVCDVAAARAVQFVPNTWQTFRGLFRDIPVSVVNPSLWSNGDVLT